MPRLPGCRRISAEPPYSLFKPAGAPVRELELTEMTLDEFEALRLADLEGLYQEDAAERLGVSRQTFGRIIESAHRKVAEALVRGKGLVVRGGFAHPAGRTCPRCRNNR
jgi:predicted DNA-binding protein (UPF0251 family)